MWRKKDTLLVNENARTWPDCYSMFARIVSTHHYCWACFNKLYFLFLFCIVVHLFRSYYDQYWMLLFKQAKQKHRYVYIGNMITRELNSIHGIYKWIIGWFWHSFRSSIKYISIERDNHSICLIYILALKSACVSISRAFQQHSSGDRIW